jgi:hypothetical protein
MAKHKYLSNFDYFSLQSNTLFGLLDYDYTHNFTNSQHVGKDLKRLEYIEIFIIDQDLVKILMFV